MSLRAAPALTTRAEEAARDAPSLRSAAVTAAALALVTHGVALAGGFVWLDHAHLERGLALPHEGLLAAFRAGFAGTGYYRPTMSLSLGLDAWLGGSPAQYHASSLLAHALCAALLPAAAAALGLSRRAGLLAALVLAVHPAGSLVASAIAFRSEALALACLLALIVWHGQGRALLAALALAAGALCKETALLLGPLLTLLPVRTGRERAVRTAEATAVVCVLVLRALYAPPYRASFPALDLSHALGTQLAALAKTFASLLVPYDGALAVCDDVAVSAPWELAPVLGLAGAGLTLGCTLRGDRLAALFGAALLPSLGLVPLARVWSPHYAYVPLAFAALWGAERVSRHGSRAHRVACALALCSLGALGLRRDLAFASDASLWPAELARAPSCREAHFYVGELARAAGELGAAERHFRAALSAQRDVLSYADERAARHQLGVVQLAQHRFDEAASSFRAALAATADAEEARRTRINLASALVGAGNARGALVALGDELARPDALLEGLLVGGRCYRALGMRGELTALLPRIRALRTRADGGAAR